MPPHRADAGPPPPSTNLPCLAVPRRPADSTLIQQIALAEKKLPYDSKKIEFSKQEHKSPAIMAINPRGQVPSFIDDDGTVVNESLAAVLYLDARYPDSGSRLVPPDARAAAPVLQRVFEVANLHAAFRDCVYPKMRGLEVSDADWAAKQEALRAELARWDAYCAAAGDGWLAGPEFSAADVAVGPLLQAVVRFGASLDATPALKAYATKVAARPSVAESWPPHWKEGEGPGFLKGV